jgi:hypothetical protein
MNKLSLNIRPYYYLCTLLFIIASSVPVYLSFHFSKVGLPRFVCLTLFAYGFASLVAYAEWKFVSLVKRALNFPVVDGKIIERVDFMNLRHGSMAYKCKIQVEYQGKTYILIDPEYYKNILDGSTVRVVFDPSNPEASKLLRENNPYLKISRSTLKND